MQKLISCSRTCNESSECVKCRDRSAGARIWSAGLCTLPSWHSVRTGRISALQQMADLKCGNIGLSQADLTWMILDDQHPVHAGSSLQVYNSGAASSNQRCKEHSTLVRTTVLVSAAAWAAMPATMRARHAIIVKRGNWSTASAASSTATSESKTRKRDIHAPPASAARLATSRSA